jgi:hypothetical protein
MDGFKFGARSEGNLVGVHADLQKIVRRALQLSVVDFSVVEGVRSLARQRDLVAQGKSRTLRSRHLTGHAVDLYPVSKAGAEWQRADFAPVVDAMKRAAAELGLPLECGHDWKAFPDSPHHQLPATAYPA